MTSFADIQNVVWPLLSAIGGFFVAAGGIGAIVYWLFKIFSERWLNAKFEERLEAFRHAQQKELEHLRFEINSLMDRTVKLHQREFEIVPEAWSLFNDAYFEISDFMGFKSYPDLNPMSGERLEEFLANSSMPEWQKDELRKQTDKTTYFIEYASWKEIADARNVYGKWQVYFLKNGIFMPEGVHAKFLALSDLLRGALVEFQIRKEEKDIKWSELKDLGRLTKEGKKLRDELEVELRERLWSSTTQVH